MYIFVRYPQRFDQPETTNKLWKAKDLVRIL